MYIQCLNYIKHSCIPTTKICQTVQLIDASDYDTRIMYVGGRDVTLSFSFI